MEARAVTTYNFPHAPPPPCVPILSFDHSLNYPISSSVCVRCTWSMAWREKLKVMNSTMGLRPLYAEPDTAREGTTRRGGVRSSAGGRERRKGESIHDRKAMWDGRCGPWPTTTENHAGLVATAPKRRHPSVRFLLCLSLWRLMGVRTDGESGEAHLRDGGVDHPLVPVLLVQALGHLSTAKQGVRGLQALTEESGQASPQMPTQDWGLDGQPWYDILIIVYGGCRAAP